MQRSGKPITEDTVAERTNDFTQSYAAAVVQLGQELKLPVVDLWSNMQAQPDWQDTFLCDGLHLTPAGNTFVYDQLQPAINKAYPDLRYKLVDALCNEVTRQRSSANCHQSHGAECHKVVNALFQCSLHDIMRHCTITVL